ncbi:hypothetical protein ABH894_003154 [Paenibacillus sp. RC62]
MRTATIVEFSEKASNPYAQLKRSIESFTMGVKGKNINAYEVAIMTALFLTISVICSELRTITDIVGLIRY